MPFVLRVHTADVKINGEPAPDGSLMVTIRTAGGTAPSSASGSEIIRKAIPPLGLPPLLYLSLWCPLGR